MSKKLLFCLFAHQQRIVVSAGDQTFLQPACKLLAQIPPNITSRNKSQTEHHIIICDSSEGGLNIIVVADKNAPQVIHVMAEFLQDIKKRFLDEYKNVFQQASINGLSDFSRTIDQRMDYWSRPENHTLSRLGQTVEKEKHVMADNLFKAMERDDTIDELQVRIEGLESTTLIYKDDANRLKNQMWWKNTKMMIILTSVILVIIAIIIIVILAIFGVFKH
eukprot:TRINITY_DN12892_c0_g1_i1.p1 TRINITY_DN12892_c0_g1~~TRINITY_DN12892_c0_g1_i1.p1  ORF type:complete len:227 (-),score=21.96 TRINITY_DN12892_c0_g1_i1:37-696(-)